MEKKNANKRNVMSTIADIVFMYIPILTVITCAIINQYPWENSAKSIKLISFLSNTNNAVIIILISYIITVGKNHFDINNKIVSIVEDLRENEVVPIKTNIEKARDEDVKSIISKIESLKVPPTADQFLANRDEIESIDHILSTAQAIDYSGGHLNSIIMHSRLDDFLKKKNTHARFIMPNPMNKNVVTLYAEKLMVNTSFAQLRMAIVSSVITLRAFQSAGYTNFEYRFYNYLPSFGIQIIEQDKKSRMHIELYTMKTELDDRVLFSVEKNTSGEMYEMFEKQFNMQWEEAKEFKDINGLNRLVEKSLSDLS